MSYRRQSIQQGICSLIFATVLSGTAAAFVQQPSENTARIAIPGVKGALEVNIGPTSWIQDLSEDGREVQLRAMGRADHLLITAFLKRMTFPASAERCRKEWWPKSKKVTKRVMQRDDLQESTVKDGIALVESTIQEFRGREVRVKDMHAYLGSRDLCAEVHLSKVEFKPDDRQLFEAVLASTRLLPDEPELKEPNSFLYIFAADRLFLHRDYASAASSYQKALDLETQHRTLTRDMFRVLIVILGEAYSLSGSPDKAKTTLERGIAEDTEYPMFYYIMAHTYARAGKMNETLEQLRLAYQYKDNMIPGDEPLRDALQDELFRKFMQDPRFVKAVREMQQR
jgi:tetratricopeptide (TPR) repeat protein